MRYLPLLSALVPFLAFIPSATAHGFLGKVTIDGKDYQGNVPNGQTNPSPIRQISDISPVKGSNNPDLNCGLNAQLASVVAPANPGSTILFWWFGGGGQNVCFLPLHYVYSCSPSTSGLMKSALL